MGGGRSRAEAGNPAAPTELSAHGQGRVGGPTTAPRFLVDFLQTNFSWWDSPAGRTHQGRRDAHPNCAASWTYTSGGLCGEGHGPLQTLSSCRPKSAGTVGWGGGHWWSARRGRCAFLSGSLTLSPGGRKVFLVGLLGNKALCVLQVSVIPSIKWAVRSLRSPLAPVPRGSAALASFSPRPHAVGFINPSRFGVEG